MLQEPCCESFWAIWKISQWRSQVSKFWKVEIILKWSLSRQALEQIDKTSVSVNVHRPLSLIGLQL